MFLPIIIALIVFLLAVIIKNDGYAILSPKAQTGRMIELEALLKEE